MANLVCNVPNTLNEITKEYIYICSPGCIWLASLSNDSAVCSSDLTKWIWITCKSSMSALRIPFYSTFILKNLGWDDSRALSMYLKSKIQKIYLQELRLTRCMWCDFAFRNVTKCRIQQIHIYLWHANANRWETKSMFFRTYV